MAGVSTFEELECWKAARVLVKKVYDLTSETSIANEYVLRDQMRRAAVSIMSNIAEGFGRNGNKEFIQFLSIARGSVAELQSQLYIVLDSELISKEKFEDLKTNCIKSNNLISGLIKYLKNTESKGYKYSDPEEEYFSEINNKEKENE